MYSAFPNPDISALCGIVVTAYDFVAQGEELSISALEKSEVS
jgi:hypothetical protein